MNTYVKGKYNILLSVQFPKNHPKLASFEEDDFIIRKRKKPKRDKHEGLKLILKVGNSSATSTPERPFDTPMSGFAYVDQQEYNFNSPSSSLHYDAFSRTHKKSKKKKKKKEKNYDKREKKKKHRKDKKRKYNKDSSQEDIRDTETENLNESLGLSIATNFNFSLQNDEKKENSQDSQGRLGIKKNEKTALQRLLESIHQLIEKKDSQQFFAWPVTDQIAPGYSLVISQPMDLNTMKRNIENNVYITLTQYIEDLQLMCKNAMIYNRPETIYYKAAKKLLHAGLKITNVDKLRTSPQMLPILSQITPEELGCEEQSSAAHSEDEEVKRTDPTNLEIQTVKIEPNEEIKVEEDEKMETEPDQNTKNEEQLAEEILEQAKKAAKEVAEKVAQKKPGTQMGFLRQKKDGTTTLAIIVPNDGIDEKTRERPVLLGSLIGRLSHGSGSLQGFREDKRNFVKTVKPLYYGAFGSYAPSYDSTFANLTKEESQLLFQTYGDETAVHYAESVLNFSKDCDYVTTMVDNLLDIMTGGDHRKTKKLLEEKKKIREEEEMEEKRLKSFMENKKTPTTSPNNGSSQVKSATLSPVNAASTKFFGFEEQPKVELNQLKSLTELGIDTSFIEYFEMQQKEDKKISDKLEQTRSLLERLHQTQYERLSSPLPPHLSQIQAAGENEHQLADKVTESLSNIIKKLPPGNVAPVAGVRKAMGVAPVPPQQQQPVSNGFPTNQFPNNNCHVANNIAVEEGACSQSLNGNYGLNQTSQLSQKITTEDETLASTNTALPTAVTGFDFESELREFLESDTSLSSFQLPDDTDDTDKTIEQMLSAHS